MSLDYEASSELLHNSAKYLFLDRNLETAAEGAEAVGARELAAHRDRREEERRDPPREQRPLQGGQYYYTKIKSVVN